MSNYSNSNHLNLARFAFNIYGTLNQQPSDANSPPSSSSSTKSRIGYFKPTEKLTYNCEREVSCLTDLELVNGVNNNGNSNNSHVVIGGKNYLKLLTLNGDQTTILNESNILEPMASASSRLPGSSKLHNFNTIKSHKNVLAGGMVNGSLNLYQVLNNGKSRVLKRFTDHKRCINSLDFLDPTNNEFSSNLVISGSQDGSIKLWDLRQANNKPSVNIVPKSNFDSVRSCQFSNHSPVKNKLVILSVHDSGTLNKYDLRSFNQTTQVPERKWNFHTGPALSLNIHPEKEYVITCGRDQKVCVWNYGENNNSYANTSPEYVLHTYGPVMKVRWCPYKNPIINEYGSGDTGRVGVGAGAGSGTGIGSGDAAGDNDDDNSDFNDFGVGSNNNNPLFNYDFACLYLNEDPTITVYNLKRRYVPKEIINSYSNKPYQNFIWAKNPNNKRSLWTLSKSNQFASRCLDTTSESESDNIVRPSESLNTVSLAWGNNIGDISLVSQQKTDFSLGNSIDKQEFTALGSNGENTIDSAIEGDSGFGSGSGSGNGNGNGIGINDTYDINQLNDYNKLVVGSVPNSFSNVSSQNTSLGSSPKEVPSSRPPLFRSSTFGASVQKNLMNKSPSPSPQLRGPLNLHNSQDLPISGRPFLGRNPSQTTLESGISLAASPTIRLDNINYFDSRRAVQINYSSPYIVPLSLPLPLNDDVVFETLSNNYLLTIPDGFSLIDVCLLNASVAASVNRFRDCQIWRMLAVGLDQHEADGNHYFEDDTLKYSQYGNDDGNGVLEADNNNNNNNNNDDDDNKSILSEYGNIGGSFNSNSTMTTNYGGSAHTELNSEKRSSRTDIPANSGSEVKSSSTNNLMDIINQHRNNSFANTISISPVSPKASRSNSMMAQVNNLRMSTNRVDDENAVEDDDNDNDDDTESQNYLKINQRYGSSQRKESDVDDTNHESTLKGEDDEEGEGQGESEHGEPTSQRRSEPPEKTKYESAEQKSEDQKSLKRPTSVPILNPNKNHQATTTSPGTKRSDSNEAPKTGSSPKNIAIMNRMRNRGDQSNQGGGTSYTTTKMGNNYYGNSFNTQRNMDLDNENFHLLNSAANSSVSSSGVSYIHSADHKSSIGSIHSNLGGSFRSRRSSSIVPTYGFLNSRNSYSNGLKEVDETTSNDSEQPDLNPIHGSGLTKALEENKDKVTPDLEVPWKVSNLLEKALDHATLQGDVILCSSLALLFFSFSKSLGLGFIKPEICLEWLSLYIEILHKKRLFVNATNILNIVPIELQEKLMLLYNSDNLKFYCERCNELIVNEETKMKYKKGEIDQFGFWFCEKCKAKVLNCIYCNEPCKGLNVVVGLKCGHRGHFGCLREWFIDDENIECPGGCNETIC